MFENLVQKVGDFQQRTVGVSHSVSPQLVERSRIEQLFHSARDIAKTLQNDSHPIFSDPLRVVALLRQCAAVALDDYRQVKLQSFADAARSRLANEEIGNSHVIVDLLREPFGKDGKAS